MASWLHMTKKKSVKRKPPTWKSHNNAKLISDVSGIGLDVAKKQVKTNNMIWAALKKHGWKFKEGYGLFDNGYDYWALSFTKNIDGIERTKNGTIVHPCVHIRLVWEEDIGPVMTMYSFYHLMGWLAHRVPYSMMEISRIYEADLPMLDQMFDGIVAALKAQNKIAWTFNQT